MRALLVIFSVVVLSSAIRVAAAQSPSATPGQQATPLSVDLAKKCDELTARAFPPREPGNPAAGSAKGSGADIQKYHAQCIANNGQMDGSTK